MQALDLWLASTSPRRRDLLARAGIRFALCAPGAEYQAGAGGEHDSEAGDPAALAAARAARKGEGAVVPDPAVPVLAVDTVVELDGRELGKARDRSEAAAMLRALAGREHRVHTAHWLGKAGRCWTALASATVACSRHDEQALQRYLDSGQWRGKAGSYGVQDDAQAFFRVVDGAFDTVVGLHVPAVRRLLQQARGNGP